MMDDARAHRICPRCLPGVVNLPLMNDEERQKVGTCYKQRGQRLPLRWATRWFRAKSKWADCGMGCICQGASKGCCTAFGEVCARRSRSSGCNPKAGIAYPRVIGGYKAMRTFLLETTQVAAQECDFIGAQRLYRHR